VITILLLAPPHPGVSKEPAGLAADHPSIEILTAASAEEALEKLARNRRIDAVLLLPGSEAEALAATLAEEDPSAPPLFAPEGMGAIAGVIGLQDGGTGTLIEAVMAHLGPPS
jgi:hypothetical protein